MDMGDNTSGLLQAPPDPKRRTPPFQLKSNFFGEFFQFIICLSATLQMDLQINPFVMST
jgi:hypothetical protein